MGAGGKKKKTEMETGDGDGKLRFRKERCICNLKLVRWVATNGGMGSSVQSQSQLEAHRPDGQRGKPCSVRVAARTRDLGSKRGMEVRVET